MIKNCNLLIPRPPSRTSKLQEKPSDLKREHPAPQNMKFLTFFYFCGSFLPFWVRIRIHITNPDLMTWLNPDPIQLSYGSGAILTPPYYESGSNDLIESGSIPTVTTLFDSVTSLPPSTQICVLFCTLNAAQDRVIGLKFLPLCKQLTICHSNQCRNVAKNGGLSAADTHVNRDRLCAKLP